MTALLIFRMSFLLFSLSYLTQILTNISPEMLVKGSPISFLSSLLLVIDNSVHPIITIIQHFYPKFIIEQLKSSNITTVFFEISVYFAVGIAIISTIKQVFLFGYQSNFQEIGTATKYGMTIGENPKIMAKAEELMQPQNNSNANQ